jgi:HAD superfamily hydrolase (TIGR01549 family)
VTIVAEFLETQRTVQTQAPRATSFREASLFDYAAWCIDLDGTLYRQSVVRTMMASELLLRGQLDIQVLREFRRQHEKLRAAAIVCQSDPYRQQIEWTANALQISEAHVAAVVERWMIDRPGKWLRLFRRRSLLRAIAEFRRKGGTTAVVSDYPARRKLEAMGLAMSFEVVVACGEPDGPRALKPHPAGLLLAAERLEVDPKRCLVIGDRVDADGEAARRAGMAFRHVRFHGSWST